MTILQRAYSTLTLKAADEMTGLIEGMASTPTTDRVGDVVEPKGAQFKLPLPLLWQHNSRMPIGHVIAAKVGKDGIQVKAKIARGLDIQWIDDAWKLLKAGLVQGLSIGFKGLESEIIKSGSGGVRYLKWDWLELSAVTIPANAEASISLIKSIDQQALRSMLSTSDQKKALALIAANSVKGLPVVRLK